MISAPSTNSKFTITFQGDSGSGGHWNGYMASRSMLRLHREDIQQLSFYDIIVSPDPGTTVRYYSDPNGDLEIPLRNLIHLNKSYGFIDLSVYLYETDGTLVDNWENKVVDTFEGISYFDLWSPRDKDGVFSVTTLLQNVIMPPNVIINPSGVYGHGIIVESNFKTIDSTGVWASVASGVPTTITPSGARYNQLVVPNTADTLRLTKGTDVKEWKLDKPEQCAEFVVCRWTSQTGAVRQHYFPIASYINKVDKSVSLVSPGNGFKVRKEWSKGCRCRITGLTDYGFWYYMDILRASDLHAIILKTGSLFSTEIASEETAAYCESTEMEMPQGNNFYNFEFTLKLRHYD